mgnify:CR=1 FL=1
MARVRPAATEATWPHFHDVLMVYSVGLVLGLLLMAGVEYAITSEVLE